MTHKGELQSREREADAMAGDIARGMFLRLTAISAVTALISAVLNWLLIPTYGAIGSAWVTVGVYGSGMIVNAGLAFWVERRQPPSKIRES